MIVSDWAGFLALWLALFRYAELRGEASRKQNDALIAQDPRYMRILRWTCRVQDIVREEGDDLGGFLFLFSGFVLGIRAKRGRKEQQNGFSN